MHSFIANAIGKYCECNWNIYMLFLDHTFTHMCCNLKTKICKVLREETKESLDLVWNSII